MSFFSPRRYAARRALRGIAAEPGGFLLALALATAALAIPLLLATLIHALAPLEARLPVQTEFTVFTLPGSGPAELEALKTAIGRMPGVAEVRHLPRDAVLADLHRRAGIAAGAPGNNPLPDLIVASLDPTLTPAAAEQIASQVKRMARVDMVALDTGWVRKLDAVARVAAALLGLLGGAVAVLILLVLAGSTRLAARTRIDELRVLHLVGATPGFMARPYAWRGALLMGLAALLACGLVALAVLALRPAVLAAATLYALELDLAMLPWPWMAAIVAAAAALGWLVAGIAARLALRRLA